MLEDQEKTVYLLFHGWTIEDDPHENPPKVWIPPQGTLALSISHYFLDDKTAFDIQKLSEA